MKGREKGKKMIICVLANELTVIGLGTLMEESKQAFLSFSSEQLLLEEQELTTNSAKTTNGN
jgi:hypothetical protein